MQAVVAATDEQWEALTRPRPQVEWIRVENAGRFTDCKTADVYFYLIGDDMHPVYAGLGKPVFINSVVLTLQELNAPSNVIRINGWTGFLQRASWEAAGRWQQDVSVHFEKAGIKLLQVADEPGLVSARILAMIINEGYLALEEKVSSKEEIDTAMKLGTNYPYGPFEWCSAIGAENILALLKKLNSNSGRYAPSALLQKEVMQHRV
ncbi:MAG TPA: 3-hydroxyacyl-CoA dehydrogenase family protein [Ferruginibacter sp.]|nr:hypothetical protein [Chitinophagaceae bacterium]HRI24676.1 3-hydroxyacyl-CoA dehydrogenase family protein [Ferruginibacter sp.]